jgi:hypothetical protein
LKAAELRHRQDVTDAKAELDRLPVISLDQNVVAAGVNAIMPVRGSDPLLDARRWLTLDGPDVAPMASSWFRGAGTPEVERHAPFLSGYGDVSRPRNGKGSGTRLLRQVHALMDAIDKSVLTLSARARNHVLDLLVNEARLK